MCCDNMIKHSNILQRIADKLDNYLQYNVDDCLDCWCTGAGDILVTKIYRCPDLTAEIYIDLDGNISGAYNRKIKHNRLGYYLIFDDCKWYFHRDFKEFTIIEEELV